MSQPTIVFCTTCKGRVQHIEKTLPKNLADNNGTSKFVLLDYNSPDHLTEYLQANHRKAIDSGRLVVYKYTEPGPFRMSHAKNMAHRLGILEGADILVNMDADNYSAPGFADYVSGHLVEETSFLCANQKSIIGRARQGLAGRICITRNTFLKMGGYNESYKTWAPEDYEFKTRMKRLGWKLIEIDNGFLYVIPHQDGLRFKEYPQAKPTAEQEAESLQQINNSKLTIANSGRFGKGVVYRNFSEEPTYLLDVPVRVFGIGMHKTATTSLHKAFRILGLDSAHWTGPWWAKKIWEEMTTDKRSPTLEQHYALSDLPFALLFKELDSAYRGSKFILTIRSEDRWIESVRKHWGTGNPWRESWNQDCFTHRMHNLLYGRKAFDEQIFRERYRRHNAEVREYFRNRPSDLLVMDMERGAGWPELCRFLGRPIPTAPYPVEFSSAARG